MAPIGVPFEMDSGLPEVWTVREVEMRGRASWGSVDKGRPLKNLSHFACSCCPPPPVPQSLRSQCRAAAAKTCSSASHFYHANPRAVPTAKLIALKL